MPRAPVSERFVLALGSFIARLFYRVLATGTNTLPAGGFLLLPNHVSFVDAVVLFLACPRPPRFVIYEEFYKNPILRPMLRAMGCIPITPRRAKDAMRRAAELIAAGEIVCVFPEGQLSRTGTLQRLERGYELIARQSNAPVVPVWLDQLWGSIFSFKGGRFFKKWPKHIPLTVRVAFGAPLPARDANVPTVREELLKLGEFCFSQRPGLHRNLAREALRGLKRRPFRNAIIDGLDGTELSCGKLLGVSVALSRKLQRECAERRIAIVLPPGKGAIIANLATVLARKIPVNLNFTASREATESALEQAGVKTTISAQAVAKRLEQFPWTPSVIHLDAALPTMRRSIFAWWIFSVIAPTALIARWLHLPTVGDREEAVLLFTSGSSGKPKGVPLTHRNVLGNIAQISALIDAGENDLILSSLPIFHSMGSTVSLWFPLVEGLRVVTYPSPLEAAKNAALVQKHKATIMLATPTFLRSYLRKAEPQKLATVRLIITGAEKLPDEMAKAFAARFGKPLMQGYGLTETSPVISVNLPDPIPETEDDPVQPSARLGSTGKMAPGIAAEIRDPETDAKLSLLETGMLWVRGANIFEGYLGDPARTAEVLRHGWFKTGDLGRFDDDGFLYIEGRLSRFSKIAGEMVPHETVEQKIMLALKLDPHTERTIAIVGVADEAKGEALVLLASEDFDLPGLRNSLSEMGVPNLWVPRTLRRVPAIPLLASGKLDLAACKEAALAPSL